MAFVTDEDSFAEMALYSTDLRFTEIHPDKYAWQVAVTTSGDIGERGYWYLLDADTGEIIGSSNDYDAFDTSR